MGDYTNEEKDTVRRAAFGAIALVSKADPGFLAMFRESAAGAKALATAPESIRQLLSGGFVLPPTRDPRQLESAVLDDIARADRILGKDPADLTGFRSVLDAAMKQAAGAVDGTSAAEQAIIDKVSAALSGGTATTS